MGERQLDARDMVMRQNEDMAALSWVNFLKTLNNGIREKTAHAELLKILEKQVLSPSAKVVSPLYQPPEESVAELLSYLNGDLKPEQSKIWSLFNRQSVQEQLTQRDISKYHDAKDTIRNSTEEIKLTIKAVDQVIADLKQLLKLPLPIEIFAAEFTYQSKIAEIANQKRNFTSLCLRIKHDEIDKTWAIDNDYDNNPDGVIQALKWAEKTIAALEIEHAKIKKLLADLETIRAEIQNHADAKSKIIDSTDNKKE